MQTLRRALRAFIVVLMVAMVAIAAAAKPAHARDYTIDKVDIDATILADGSLDVVETRAFNFDGHFNGVYWDISQGEYEGRTIEVEIVRAGVVEDGSFIAFSEGYSEENHTYEVNDNYDYTELKLFNQADDETVYFQIEYKLSNLVGRHEDAAELYWKFVSDGWQVESENVTCIVHLPVPEGESVVPEDNCRAWGHGPLDATVYFNGSDVEYTVPGVGSYEFAEARITFPEHWVPEATQQGGTIVDDIVAEETEWADEANERRQEAIEHMERVNTGGTVASGVGVAAALGTLGLVFKKRKEYQETRRTLFDDDYYRDVPTGDHPAVLGTLYNDGSVPEGAFTATLMRLTDDKLIFLEKRQFVKNRIILGDKVFDDFCISFDPNDHIVDPIQGQVARDANHIDQKALDFLRWLARKAGDENLLQFSSIKKTAQKKAEQYKDRYDGWTETVNAVYTKRFTTTESNGMGVLIAVGVIEIILAIVLVFAMLILEFSPLPALIGGAALLVSGIIACFTAASADNLNAEGREVKAKLEALRRWLRDFTRLNEAVPQDVILWNRLLVMAVALGVSEEVLKQLEMYYPQILDDPMIRSTYYWYYADSMLGSPASAFASAMEAAHSVSEAQLASSDWSSGGGGGGGFSGGGGGGFGGGGGGGAF